MLIYIWQLAPIWCKNCVLRTNSYHAQLIFVTNHCCCHAHDALVLMCKDLVPSFREWAKTSILSMGSSFARARVVKGSLELGIAHKQTQCDSVQYVCVCVWLKSWTGPPPLMLHFRSEMSKSQYTSLSFSPERSKWTEEALLRVTL